MIKYDKLRRVVIGAPLDPLSQTTRQHIALAAFIAWVGLRGAVPIYLAVIPVLAGVPGAELGFALAFAIVLISLVVQGWTVGPAARLLRLSSAG